MCEIIISVVDKGDDTHWVKRGTVIETLEDGHDYGAEELTNPMFRIIKIPGAALSWGRAFMGMQIDNPNTAQQASYRMFKLDVDNISIPNALKNYLLDSSRAQPAFTVNTSQIPLATLAALKVARVYSDPNILGNPSNVIG